MILGAGIPLVLGFFPRGVAGSKPLWWRIVAFVSPIILFGLAFGVPTGGHFGAAKVIAMTRGDQATVPIMGTVVDASGVSGGVLALKDAGGNVEQVLLDGPAVAEAGLKEGDVVILTSLFTRRDSSFHARSVRSVNPMLALPLIPDLEERARNLYLHVPMAWVSQLAWFVAFGFAIAYLRKRKPEHDVIASSAAALGAVFCILATVTGMVWAQFNWGVFWNWDPRQTSIAIVLVIYGAYFALRSALDNDEQKAKVSAIYLIVLLLPVLFFMFVFPRLEVSLHPGAKGDVNAGPVLSQQADALDPVKQAIYAFSLFSFILLYFWMLNVTVRARLVEYRRRRRAIELEEAATGRVGAIEQDVVRLT